MGHQLQMALVETLHVRENAFQFGQFLRRNLRNPFSRDSSAQGLQGFKVLIHVDVSHIDSLVVVVYLDLETRADHEGRFILVELLAEAAQSGKIQIVRVDGLHLFIQTVQVRCHVFECHACKNGIEINHFPSHHVHRDPEEEEHQLAVKSLKDPPCAVKLRVQQLPIKRRRFQGITFEIRLVVVVHHLDEIDEPLHLSQLVLIVVGQDLLFHLPFGSELLPACKELKLIHHLEDLAHGHVTDAAHGADLLIREPVPVHVAVRDDLDHGLVKVEKLREFLLFEVASLRGHGLSHAHEPAVPKQIERFMGLTGSRQV